MKVFNINIGNFKKPFVVDSNNHVIAAADNHFARCVGENANWQPMREFKFAPKWSEGVGLVDRLGHVLGMNPFTDIGNMVPRPSENRKFFRGESFNHQVRAFSLLNPSRLQEGLNLLGITEINFDLVTMWATPRRIDRAVLYTLSIVSQAGWKVDETFTRFTLAKELAQPDTKVRGVILGSCENWLEALLCATLISAGYFVVCYDPLSTPSPYYPAIMDIVRFGIHPLYFNSGTRCLTYVYVDDICLPKTTAVLDMVNPASDGLVIMSRAKEIDETLAHCGLWSLRGVPADSIVYQDPTDGGTNLAIHHMPSAKQFNALDLSDKEYVESSTQDAANLANYSMGELHGFGLNEFNPKMQVSAFGLKMVRPLTNDAFDEDVDAKDLYDDVTKYSAEEVVVYEPKQEKE